MRISDLKDVFWGVITDDIDARRIASHARFPAFFLALICLATAGVDFHASFIEAEPPRRWEDLTGIGLNLAGTGVFAWVGLVLGERRVWSMPLVLPFILHALNGGFVDFPGKLAVALVLTVISVNALRGWWYCVKRLPMVEAVLERLNERPR